jgi:hypothetical protein
MQISNNRIELIWQNLISTQKGGQKHVSRKYLDLDKSFCGDILFKSMGIDAT